MFILIYLGIQITKKKIEQNPTQNNYVSERTVTILELLKFKTLDT